MQKTIGLFSLIILLLTGLSACDNELNVAAEWEEVTVVYGALDPVQPKNYIRIQRAYLDENSAALNFSTIQDSLYYDTLSVTMEEYKNGTLTHIYTLKRVNGNDLGLPKDSGVFYSEENMLYELSDPVIASEFVADYDYKLIIKNPKTGKIVTGLARSMGKPEVKNPVSETTANLFVKASTDHNVIVRYREGKWVKSYTIVLEAHIEEFKLDNPSEKVIKSVKWNMLTDGYTRSFTNFEEVSYLAPSINFFYTLAANLDEDPTVGRRLLTYDIRFYGISDDFNTYLSVNKPSLGIVQKKPEFTNITNGLGLFTSRHIKEFEGKTFNSSTLEQINMSEITNKLGFVE